MLKVTRAQILAFRRRTGSLDHRLPAGKLSLQRAAWAGLQDSMPRAALLSIHARVEGVAHTAWEDPALVQVWGPRYQVYVVAAPDHALFTLARLPESGKTRVAAEKLVARLEAALAGERMRDRDVGRRAGRDRPEPALRDTHRPALDPLGGRTRASCLDRSAADDQRAGGAARARAPLPPRLRPVDRGRVREVGRDRRQGRRRPPSTSSAPS